MCSIVYSAATLQRVSGNFVKRFHLGDEIFDLNEFGIPMRWKKVFLVFFGFLFDVGNLRKCWFGGYVSKSINE